MRRVIKYPDSKIIQEELKYIKGNSYNNNKIAAILFEEQKKFCAYTDEYISRTDAKDIEHFNPNLKGTSEDNYYNWFLVKHQWNKEKSYNWDKYQPILYPTAEDFEDRVVYIDGDYTSKNSDDNHAKNVIKLLQLDDPGLAEKRKKYISRKRKEIENANEHAFSYFSTLIDDDPCNVHYLRAIKEEFGIDVWEIVN